VTNIHQKCQSISWR